MFLLTYETSCFLMRFCFIIPGSFLLSNFFSPSLGKFPYHLVQVSFQPTHRPWHFRLDEPSQVRAVSSAPDSRNLFMNACRWALLMQVLLQMCKESGRHQVCWNDKGCGRLARTSETRSAAKLRQWLMGVLAACECQASYSHIQRVFCCWFWYFLKPISEAAVKKWVSGTWAFS